MAVGWFNWLVTQLIGFRGSDGSVYTASTVFVGHLPMIIYVLTGYKSAISNCGFVYYSLASYKPIAGLN